MGMHVAKFSAVVAAGLFGCAAMCWAEPPARAAGVAGLVEVFPGVRVDRAARVVEFDAAISPMLVKDAKAPNFYLEVIACSPDTREHETLVVTKVKPSHIHAALLMIDVTPGEPGGWTLAAAPGATPANAKPPTAAAPDAAPAAPVPIAPAAAPPASTQAPVEGTRPVPAQPVARDPRGDAVAVEFRYVVDGKEVVANPLEWIVEAQKFEGDGKPAVAPAARRRFVEAERARPGRGGRGEGVPGFVFAGSLITKVRDVERYAADGSGVVIGLMTFGSEVIAYGRTISPEAAVEAPVWVADLEKTPPAGTAVRVRVMPMKKE